MTLYSLKHQAFWKGLLASASLATMLIASTAPVPLIGTRPAFAQSVVTLDKIEIAAGGMSVSIPSIVVEGSSLSQAELRAMFDAGAIDKLAQRFAAFSARSVSIPVMTITQKLPDGGSGITVYRDTMMRDIRNGIIGEAVTPVTTSKSLIRVEKSKENSFETVINDTRFKQVNLVLMARFLADRAQPGETLQLAIAEQSTGKATMTFDKASLTVGKSRLHDLKLRPMREPLMASLDKLKGDSGQPSEQNNRDALAFASDFLSGASLGGLELTDIAGHLADDKGKPASFSLNNFRMAGGGDVPGAFSWTGLTLDAADARVSLAEFAIAGIRYPGLLGSLERLSKIESSKTPDFRPEEFVPIIANIRVGGVDVDAPDPKNRGQRIKAKLGLFNLDMNNHVGAIPADVRIALDHAQFEIPSNTKEKGLKDILALGYKSLDVSMAYDQVWDQTSKILKLNTLSLASAGMFTAHAKAELGNVTRELFTLDKAVAGVAALGLVAKSVSVVVKNDSLFDKLIAQQAAGQNRKPEDVRAELAAGATLMVPLFLGEHPGAKALGAALGRFIADPKSLTVDLKAQGSGLGAVDFLAVKNPIELLKKVDITASTQN